MAKDESKTIINIDGPLYPYSENDSRLIQEQIKDAGPDAHLEVHWHSPGGSVWEGKKLFTMFLNHKGQVDMVIDGLCASAASYAAMAGNRLFVYDYSEFMIHSAMTWLAFLGNAKALEDLIPQLEKQVDELRAEDRVIANIYAKRAALDVGKVQKWMEAETTWRGNEILKAGFATDLIETPARDKQNLQPFDLSPYRMAADSAYHEQFCQGIDAYQSWNVHRAPAHGPSPVAPALADAANLRRVAEAQATARNRMLALKHGPIAAGDGQPPK